MAKYKCPSCGAPYDGKRCRECLFEPFTEEISHGTHTHTGEPLVIDAPVRKPVPQTDPFGCEKKTKKRRSSRRLGCAMVLILLSTLSPMLTFLFHAVSETHSVVSSFLQEPEPESIAIPEHGTLLYDDGQIQVIADWQEGQDLSNGFSVILCNDSSQDAVLCTSQVIANDYVLEYSFLFCEASAESTGKGYLYLEETDLRNAQLTSIQDLTFSLILYDPNSYETIAETDPITLCADLPAGSPRHSDLGGTPLLDQDGIQIRYLGYAPDPGAPESFTEGSLLFYVENNTDRCLQVWMPEVTLDGEPLNLGLWSELPSGTRAVTSVCLYDLEDSGIDDLETLEQAIFQLEIDDWEADSFSILPDPFQPAALPG